MSLFFVWKGGVTYLSGVLSLSRRTLLSSLLSLSPSLFLTVIFVDFASSHFTLCEICWLFHFLFWFGF